MFFYHRNIIGIADNRDMNIGVSNGGSVESQEKIFNAGLNVSRASQRCVPVNDNSHLVMQLIL